jgi:glycosyltransferase involved in cell wall biosynthesis
MRAAEQQQRGDGRRGGRDPRRGESAWRGYGIDVPDDGNERQRFDGEHGTDQEPSTHAANLSAGAAAAHLIIPALDEEAALPLLLARLPPTHVARVIVVDNGSRDGTAAVAQAGGAEVVHEPRRGYGAACQAGLRRLSAEPDHAIVAFVDADGSSDPAELPDLLAPLAAGQADFVIGSRVLGTGSAVPIHARFGNALAVRLIALRTGQRFTDLGPLRAARLGTMRRLLLRDLDYGWNVEMQMRVARLGVRWTEVPVQHRDRSAGASKISGRVTASVLAGIKILWTVLRHAR